jgi:hypothetical protein
LNGLLGLFQTFGAKTWYLNAPDPAQLHGYNRLRHVRKDRIALAASGLLDAATKRNIVNLRS